MSTSIGSFFHFSPQFMEECEKNVELKSVVERLFGGYVGLGNELSEYAETHTDFEARMKPMINKCHELTKILNKREPETEEIPLIRPAFDIDFSISKWSALEPGERNSESRSYEHDKRHEFYLKVIKEDVRDSDPNSARIGVFLCYKGPATEENPVTADYQFMVKDRAFEKVAYSFEHYRDSFWNGSGSGFEEFAKLSVLQLEKGYDRIADKISLVCRIWPADGFRPPMQPREEPLVSPAKADGVAKGLETPAAPAKVAGGKAAAPPAPKDGSDS